MALHQDDRQGIASWASQRVRPIWRGPRPSTAAVNQTVTRPKRPTRFAKQTCRSCCMRAACPPVFCGSTNNAPADPLAIAAPDLKGARRTSGYPAETVSVRTSASACSSTDRLLVLRPIPQQFPTSIRTSRRRPVHRAERSCDTVCAPRQSCWGAGSVAISSVSIARTGS